MGDAPVNWYSLDAGDNRHPVISVNFYRLLDGRMEQLAKSWVKHGFWAVNASDCAGIPEVTRPCESHTGSNQLRPGCSDLYGETLNSNPAYLGPRSKINPATGAFDAATARDLTGYPKPCTTTTNCPDQAEQVMLVEEADLRQPTARYFVEAHYIAADDAAAGNSRNNMTYKEFKPVLQFGRWSLNPVRPEVRRQPAIVVWRDEGAQLAEIETPEDGAVKTYIIVGSKVNPAPGGKFRYEYAIYNSNSELAIQSFSVPATGVDAATVGFKAPNSNAEIWSNDQWQNKIEGGKVTWSTKTFAENQNANAIRWGSTYNFWFLSDRPPTNTSATIARFKPSALPAATAIVQAPGN
jgi:hypothetical protein